jgi:nucleoside-diphosphate-sugar epimerase
MSSNTSKTIAITGGLGNLGTKLSQHLLSTTSHRILLLEHPAYITPAKTPEHPSVTLLPIDLGSSSAIEKLNVLKDVDTVVHFSAVNPYPNATWSESAQSMDHTFVIFQAAVLHRGEKCTGFE